MAEIDATDVGTRRPPADRDERYFWHDKIWAGLVRELDKIPHALLLYGPDGLGKRAFAWRLAQSLLCTAVEYPDANACGQCQSCRRFLAGVHPDLLPVGPAGESVAIVVDQIREVRDFVSLRPHTAARKLVIVEPAEAMNLNAANALLKVLEEPPSSSLLILVTPRATRLPATIRSRCVPISFRPPGSLDAAAWLRARGVPDKAADGLLSLAGGAPLRAAAFAGSGEMAERDAWLKDVEALRMGREDPLRCAARWKGYGANRCLEWFQRYTAQLVETAMTGRMDSEKLKTIRDLFRYSDVLSEAKAVTGGSLDETLLLEDILLRWSSMFRPLV